MRITITGGAGFLGARLARTLLAEDPAAELVLTDLVPPADDLAGHERVRVITGDVADVAVDAVEDADAIVHLAAVVSAAAEADFDLGMRANIDASRALLDAARHAGRRLRFVFASSLAVFGGEPGRPLPAVVTDDTVPTPASSYGIQKLIGEQLVADHTRKGHLLGRSVRLQTVTVRPGRPNAAASGFLSGIVREPLAGLRATCPVPLDTSVAVSSPANAIAGLRKALDAGEDEWPWRTAVTLPALTTSPAQMLAALDRVVGEPLSELVDVVPDPAVAAVVTSWPSAFRTDRAAGLGLTAEPDFDAIVRSYLAESAGR